MIKSIQKLNSLIIETIPYGEDVFYARIASMMKGQLKSNCVILKNNNDNGFKVFGHKRDPQLELIKPLNGLSLANDFDYKSQSRLDRFILNSIVKQGYIKKESVDASQVVVKTVKSLHDKRKLSAIILFERKNNQPTFSPEELFLIDNFRDLFVMATELIKSERILKKAKTQNSELKQMVSLNFPNPTLYPYITEEVNVVYLALDVRNSVDLNKFIVANEGEKSLAKFYLNFREYCDHFAVEENKAWFKKQIGDSMQYAWIGENAKNLAISTALKINNNLHMICNTKIFSKIMKIGIGVADGLCKPDYDIHEIKGDAARLAFTLQEKRIGVFSTYKPDQEFIKNFENGAYKTYKRNVLVRDTKVQVYEIRLNENLSEVDLKKEESLEALTNAMGMRGDSHIHIEGIRIDLYKYMDIFQNAVKYFNRNPEHAAVLENVTHQKLTDILNNYLNSYSEKQTRFSFSEFLTLLFASKTILASRPEYVYKFVFEFLDAYFNKYWHIRFGITPSILTDFTYIDKQKWINLFSKAISDALDQHTHATIDIIIESKRKDFETNLKDPSQSTFKSHIEFYKMLKRKLGHRVNFVFSICDDASQYPLFLSKYFDGVDEYLEVAKSEREVGFAVHMLETLPFDNSYPSSVSNLIQNNPAYELEYMLDMLDGKGIYGASFIHMCNIFNAAPFNPDDRTLAEQCSVNRGLTYLERIADRHDRIVVCYSSNLCIKTPFILGYPEIVSKLITGQLNITIGSDDPGPFKIKDVTEDLRLITKFIEESYENGLKLSNGKVIPGAQLAKLVKFVLMRNSWLKWDSQSSNWLEIRQSLVQRKHKIQYEVYQEFMKKDLLENMSDLGDSKTITKLLKVL